MADSVSFENVLRELDEANARYFALTLKSKASRYKLEIPATFTTETGWPGDDNCALVTSITIEKEWPLRFRRFPDMRQGVSAVSVGEGWARFMSDQGLGLGALLTFEVVDKRRLVVGIHRRSALTEQQAFQQLPNASLLACDARVTAQVDNSFPDHPPQPSLHKVRGDARPHFQKTLRKTHTKNCATSRLDVPTAYWREQGLEGFNGTWYILRGPLSPWTVKSATYTFGSHKFCSFTQGGRASASPTDSSWATHCCSRRLDQLNLQ